LNNHQSSLTQSQKQNIENIEIDNIYVEKLVNLGVSLDEKTGIFTDPIK